MREEVGPVGQRRRGGGRRASSEDAFEAFYAEHWVAVVVVVRALCREDAVAEELAQEAFLRAYGRWGRVSALDRPELWVRRVALNLAISRFRRLQVEARALVRLGAERPAPAQPLPAEVEPFVRALRRLPTRQGRIAALYYLDDLSVAQVAEVVGCAEGTVKSQLHAARARLRDELAELLDHQPDHEEVDRS